MALKLEKNIAGKSGRIIKLIQEGKGRAVEIRLDDGRIVKIGVGYLMATDKFMRMSADEMQKELAKPFHGYKKGQKVRISNEEPVYA